MAAIVLATGWLPLAKHARAASLQQVQNWSNDGVPNDVSMYVYVPDEVASLPPVLTLVHYCGGTAPAVFGQAQGGGIVAAADQHGFIMVVPSSGRCWDVVSDTTRTRDGGGDSHAIRQMITHALAAYGGNPERVYVTGNSSGGMMTQLLLGLYPDVFKAGSAFAGMPAGCRGPNESGDGGGYSGACAGGNVDRTGQEWGDIARSLYPGYSARRPRVQLFHGDDDEIITFPNQREAVEQWSNVLGLATSPTSTTTLALGEHQASRQSWTNECGYTVLDAFTSLGGDHGPSDALFPAQHVIPFLSLDKTGAVDPEVEQCQGSAGSAGSGAAGGGGIGGGSGGISGAAGASGGGGAAGGSVAGGGGVGGVAAATGGASSAGALAAGGAPMPTGGTSFANPSPGTDGGGCACAAAGAAPSHPLPAALGVGALLLARVRRRRGHHRF